LAYINPSTQSLKTCFQTHYSLPYFQREYKWETRHFEELINDIQDAFQQHYEASHSRKEVANYSPYFLGSIITSSEKSGKKPLIDGQQRLTSTFLLLAFLERYRRDNNVADTLSLSSYLGSTSFGEMDYSIEFGAKRKEIFNRYLNFNKSTEDAISDAEDVTDIDEGDKKILSALRATDSLINAEVRGAIAYFIDYVVERVLLIDISVSTEAEAHRVFVTMNDRGLRLGPIDLLKGHILSKILDPNDSRTCHSTWMITVNQLRELGSEEDSLFFRNLLRAKWADSIRGKSKGDQAGDFDYIGDAYHRWFEDNISRIGFVTADSYVKFARDILPKYAEVYEFIKNAEMTLTVGYESIYYNAVRKASFQAMVLLSAVKTTDHKKIWKDKIALVSRFIDLMLTTRTIDGKINNYDNLKLPSFVLTKEIRDKDYPDLLLYIRSEWMRYYPIISNISNVRYAKSKPDRSDILYLLARIASFLEESFALPSRLGFSTYWQRDKGMKTYDIEHLLSEKYDAAALPADHGFFDGKDYSEARNLLGALVLLPRSRNRSLQHAPYRDKLAAYATENILAQTLTSQLYQNNPNVAAYVSSNPTIPLSAISDFAKSDIDRRTSVYVALAEQIWQSP
jgi:hypothetical protein